MLTEKIRVLHVIARFNIGGTARYLAHLLPELENAGVDTLLATGCVQKGEVEDSILTNLKFVRIENLGRRINIKQDVASFFRIRRVIKNYRPNLIQTHTFKAGLLCRLMFFRIPKAHTYHGHLLTDPEFSKSQKKVMICIEKLLAIFAKKLIVTGQQVATDLLINGVGIPNQYISIPGQGQLKDVLPREAARRNIGLGNEFTILWAARVVPVKNPKLLVEIANLMPNCKFLMAGDGLELDSIRLSAPPNLVILGFIDVKDIIMAADVYLSTSLNEGIPYSIIEAQSVGIPTVAVNAGALAEIISDGINGFLVEPIASKIVERLSKLQNNPELLEELSAATFQVAPENHQQCDLLNRHIEVYAEILKRN